ncbi:phage capsid protein [Rhodopseudomonas sp. P2A-2r]|uniref:phage capsid protein n=1 Tax=Rhodopseudomonas sp. P2A-2r TaxID=2991972 RepID=UPI002234C8F7|nr:phage capsid protein [Rhodopseudomonas sp. P2A-2r]UZE47916.1 phage capsid protein [Rhodopseudomonas sp. P2A-2r]
MAGPVSDTHRIMYRDQTILAIQEKHRQFDDFFNYLDGMSGKQVQVTQIIGPSEARLNAPEGGDTPDIESTHEPIWAKPTRIDWGKLIKKEDQIKALTDYKSEYVQGGANAYVRAHNALLASAVFGPCLIGNEVPTSTSWAGRTVPVDLIAPGTPAGMSVKKILNGMQLMETDDITLEEESLALAMTAVENEQLWNDLTHISKDYRSKAQLDDMSQRVRTIFDIPIIITKRLGQYDASTYQAGLFCRSALHWGPFMPMDIKSAQNPAKQFREHVYIEGWEAATRSEDYKVVKILNKK